MKNSSVSLWFLTATLFAAPVFSAEPTPADSGLAPGKHARRERLLQRFDTNHDGKLDEAERVAARETFRQHQGGHARMEMRARIVARFDRDGDGRLNEAERAEARQARQHLRERRQTRRAEMLQHFDANHDGKLDQAERGQVQQAWREFLQSRTPAAAGGNG